jgi:hypothetical protein
MKETIMKYQFFTIIFVVLAVFFATDTFALRCGKHLVDTGDKSFEVLKKCGEPTSKETVGYTLKGDRRELKIKEWIYGPWNGQYYYLTFHGTTLVNIESRRDPM